MWNIYSWVCFPALFNQAACDPYKDPPRKKFKSWVNKKKKKKQVKRTDTQKKSNVAHMSATENKKNIKTAQPYCVITSIDYDYKHKRLFTRFCLWCFGNGREKQRMLIWEAFRFLSLSLSVSSSVMRSNKHVSKLFSVMNVGRFSDSLHPSTSFSTPPSLAPSPSLSLFLSDTLSHSHASGCTRARIFPLYLSALYPAQRTPTLPSFSPEWEKRRRRKSERYSERETEREGRLPQLSSSYSEWNYGSPSAPLLSAPLLIPSLSPWTCSYLVAKEVRLSSEEEVHTAGICC